MSHEDLMFAAAVQAAARVNHDREFAAWMADSHPSIHAARSNDFRMINPLEVFMIGAYREIMEAKDVVERLRKAEMDALLSAQRQPPGMPPTEVFP